MQIRDVVTPGKILLNAATGAGSGDSSTIGAIDQVKKTPWEFLARLALAAGHEVANWVASTPGQPLRNSYLRDTAPLADEAIITIAGFQVYEVVSIEVDGVAARKPVGGWTYIERIKTDPLSRTSIPKYFDIREQKLKHNGSTAVVTVIAVQDIDSSVVPAATDDVNVPDPLLNAVIAVHQKMASIHGGTEVQTAEFWRGCAQAYEQMIRSGASALPPIVQREDAA